MRFALSRGHESLRQVVRQHAEPHTVTRGDDTIGDMGEEQETTATHTANAWLFAPRNNPLGTDYGDRLQGELNGLALPSEDWQHADEIEHGGETYRVDEPFHVPNEADQQLQVFALERKTN